MWIHRFGASAFVAILVLVPFVSAEELCRVDCDDDMTEECDQPVCADDEDGEDGDASSTCSWLDQWGVTVDGHIQQGTTTNSRNPANPSLGVGNLPATQFNYRNDEYMLNQIMLRFRRETDTSDCGWDIGGEVNLVYGTDYIFLQSRGLETHGDFSNRWNSSGGVGFGGNGLMGLALPQMYLEIAYNETTVKIGHFYHPLGYEHKIPTENFYYSTTYGSTFSFEQDQIVGLQAEKQLTDGLSLGGGFHRGMGNWEDNNDKLNGFGMLSWKSLDESTSLSFVFDLGKEDNAGQALRYLQSAIFEQEIDDRWSYVLYSDYGFQQDALADGEAAQWYNIVQRLSYEINPCWTAGIRFERFDDCDGFIVTPTPGPGVYYDVTLGLNYAPDDRLIARPEIRWDWFDADAGVGPGPFKDGTRRSQFMAALDVIIKF